ncbi:hypothetical protein D3C78_1436330 [compost metagenome]
MTAVRNLLLATEAASGSVVLAPTMEVRGAMSIGLFSPATTRADFSCAVSFTIWLYFLASSSGFKLARLVLPVILSGVSAQVLNLT